MGRLIDADLLKECYAGTNSLDGKADYMSIRKMIDNQPTAYDVEKVIHKIDETLFEFGTGNDCTRCAFREVCDDGNDGCIETMAEVFRNTVRMGGVE